MQRPVAISIVDASGVLQAAVRMDGSRFHAVDSSLTKAMSAASAAAPTGRADDMVALKLGLATFGKQVMGLRGGVPIIVEGRCIGGIGAGSASGEEDEAIVLAGLRAIEGAQATF